MAQLSGCHSTAQNVAGTIPGQVYAWDVGSVPSWGGVTGNQPMFLSHIDVSLPLLLQKQKNKKTKKTKNKIF